MQFSCMGTELLRHQAGLTALLVLAMESRTHLSMHCVRTLIIVIKRMKDRHNIPRLYKQHISSTGRSLGKSPYMALCTDIQSHLSTVLSLLNRMSGLQTYMLWCDWPLLLSVTSAGCVIGHHQALQGLVSCVDKECKYALYSI